MTPERMALVKRIKKLLALGTRNPNANESAAALAKAQELMAAHQVDELELACIVERDSAARIARRPPVWQSYLARKISEAFGLERFIDRAEDGRTVMHFVGAEYRIEIGVYAFNVLARQARSAVRKFMATCKARKSGKRARIAEDFCYGFLLSACSLLAKIAPPSEQEAAALVKYMQRFDLVDTKGKGRKGKLGEAGFAGMIAGDGATLHHGTPGTAPGQIDAAGLLLGAGQ